MKLLTFYCAIFSLYWGSVYCQYILLLFYRPGLFTQLLIRSKECIDACSQQSLKQFAAGAIQCLVQANTISVYHCLYLIKESICYHYSQNQLVRQLFAQDHCGYAASFNLHNVFFSHCALFSTTFLCHPSMSLHSLYFLYSFPVDLYPSSFVYWCLLSLSLLPPASFSILNKSLSILHVNPSVSFSPSSPPHSLILVFICLSLAHLRSVYPVWFYLHQNEGTRSGTGSIS